MNNVLTFWGGVITVGILIFAVYIGFVMGYFLSENDLDSYDNCIEATSNNKGLCRDLILD